MKVKERFHCACAFRKYVLDLCLLSVSFTATHTSQHVMNKVQGTLCINSVSVVLLWGDCVSERACMLDHAVLTL